MKKAMYFDHWWNRYVECEIIEESPLPIIPILIRPLDGALKGRILSVSPIDLRNEESLNPLLLARHS